MLALRTVLYLRQELRQEKKKVKFSILGKN